MAYLSPFRYLPADAVFPVDALVMQRARKKLLAEFDLGSTEVQGMSKHDALQWLDNLNADELGYHKLIYDRPAILMFLEKGEVSKERWYEGLPSDDRAGSFIQGLVQHQFNSLFSDAFQKNDVTRLWTLATFDLPEVDKKGRYYYSGAMNLLTSYYHQFVDIAQKANTNAALLQQFLDQPFFGSMGALPPYFNAMRNEFAITLLQTAEKLTDDEVKDHMKDYYAASLLLKTARSVAASPEIVKQASAKFAGVVEKTSGTSRAILHPDVQAQQEPKKTSYKGCLIAGFIIITIIRLLMLVLG